MARKICATVFAFDTGSGLTGIGLPTSHDSMKPLMIMMSRETTRMTSEIGSAPAIAERDIDRHDQRLVGQRIEIGAELARHAEALGQEAVDGVAHPGRQEQKERGAHLARG